MDILQTVGAGAVAAGLIALFGRLYLDPKLEALKSDNNTLNETIKARLQRDIEAEKATHAKRIQIHAVQFNEQFKVYRTLYRAAVLLQWRLYQIMPALDMFPEDKTWADVAPERFDRASKTLKYFVRVFEYNEPLVSPELRPTYEKLIEKSSQIRGLIRLELHYQISDKKGGSRPAYKEGQEDPYMKMERLIEEFKTLRGELREFIAKKVGALYDAEISQ